ncbi:hypothetical protein ACFL1S_00900 [Pseudomonadota bacterium]
MIADHLLERLEASSRMFHSRIHGVNHWRTVARNGLYLAQFSGADRDVVLHFAFFHDCRRKNEGYEPRHGPRSAAFLKTVRQEIALNNVQFKLLIRACSGHTQARKSTCPTLGTCWDADRLDLGRVGIRPRSRYLFTDRAKEIADSGDFTALAEFEVGTDLR